MGPVKFRHEHNNIINGSPPAPLKINRASHASCKSSSTTSASSNSISSTSLVKPVTNFVGGAKRRNHPIIIYTKSPKVIHTQPNDFMALVQRLTGHSRTSKGQENAPLTRQDEQRVSDIDKGSKPEGAANKNMKDASSDHDDKSSSISTFDKSFEGNLEGGDVRKPQNNPFFANMPLFTPNSASFFYSPRPVHKFPDSGYESPNMGNSISPSAMEFLKKLTEY